MPRKKPFFAQMDDLNPKAHRAKYFDSQQEARKWLATQGGGTIRHRRRGEYGWGIVETVISHQ